MLNIKRRRRLILIVLMVLGVGCSTSLVLVALNKNINLYYTPSQINQKNLPKTRLRLGGLVKNGSIHRAGDTLKINFIVTDNKHEISVVYVGILPALFREGQGVVVEGEFLNQHFIAKQVLAKHDENYRPPGLK